MATPEGEIVRTICDYLEAKRIFHWRQNNTGKMPGGRFASVKKGVPDIIALKGGKFYGIEVKTPDGKLSSEQAEFGRLCIKNGAEYIVARSIEDVQAIGL